MKGHEARLQKRDSFPYRVGDTVSFPVNMRARTGYWSFPNKPKPISRMAGLEGVITALNVADGEVCLGKLGWTRVFDLDDGSDILWDDDEILDDDSDEILDDELDEIIEDDESDDEEVLEDDDDDILED